MDKIIDPIPLDLIKAELTYRAAGGCSGRELDLDEYDFLDKPYQQLIVWDPDAQAIIGGYRFILGKDVILPRKSNSSSSVWTVLNKSFEPALSAL